jgi:hypothetical protein
MIADETELQHQWMIRIQLPLHDKHGASRQKKTTAFAVVFQ